MKPRRLTPPGDPPMIDQLADLMADHDLDTGRLPRTLKQCADELGIEYTYANALLQRMRMRLGPWAR